MAESNPGRSDGSHARPSDLLDNADPRLQAAWHVVAGSDEVGAEPSPAWLLGTCWLIHREPGPGRSIRAVGRDGTVPHEVREACGLVWLAPLAPLAPFPRLEEPADDRFACALLTRRTPVAAGVLVDNFLDVSHFSYLHSATFGRVSPVTTANCLVERRGWLVCLQHSTDLSEGQAQSGQGFPPDSPSWRVATYSVLAPFVTHLSLVFPATGARSAATLTCQAETADRTTVRVLVSWPAKDPAGLAEQVQLSRAVLAEDLSILELMADPRLELALRAELHTRADRASVEYRRLIADHLAAVGHRTVAA